MQSQVRPCLPVHPRLRGELGSTRDKMTGSIGSSPLTRGTRVQTRRSRQRYRFIPAYAGNSLAGDYLSWWRSVHPRLRGELSRSTTPPTVLLGPSPLTRGTQRREKPAICFDRFIPAYAGNSNDHFRPLRNFEVHPRLRGELPAPIRQTSKHLGSSPLTRGTLTTRMRPER